MPIVREKHTSQALLNGPSIDLLFDPNEQLTLEGRVLLEFVEDLDGTEIFDDPEIREIVETSEEFAKMEDGEWVECNEGDDGAERVMVESIDTDLLIELVDTDDLTDMFMEHLINLPSDGIEEKTMIQVAVDMVGEDKIDRYIEEFTKPWARGEFKKIYKGSVKSKGGRTGPEFVNSMLGAMLAKQAVKRAKKQPVVTGGKGVKLRSGKLGFRSDTSGSGGKYQKGPQYGGGTDKGVGQWMKFKSKYSGQTAKALKSQKGGAKTLAARKKIAASMQGIKKKLALKKGEAMVKGKASVKAKIKAKKASKAAKVTDSHDDEQQSYGISEGAGLTSRMMQSQKRQQVLNETAA